MSSPVLQTLPAILEQRATTEPDGVFAKVPISTTYAEGFRSVTYLELLSAVNRVAWLLEEQFGKSQNFPTIAYLGPGDLRYSIVVLAGIKSGYKVNTITIMWYAYD